MIKKSEYITEKGYRKEEKEFYKNLNRGSGKELVKSIRDSIHNWKDKEIIFDGYGHEIVPPDYLLTKNVPQEIVNHFTRRYYGYKDYDVTGYDEVNDEMRYMEPNEYIDGIIMYRFTPIVCVSLGLEQSRIYGRGSSCRQNSNRIREYLGIPSIEEEWKKEQEESEMK